MSFDPERARAIIAARAQQPADPLATGADTILAPPQPIIEEEEPMADPTTDIAAITAKATADAIAAISTRNAAVTASEHYKGREAIANAMINDPEMAGKSADSIIAIMKLSPAMGETARDLDSREEADARAMLAGIAAAQPAVLGADPKGDAPAMSEADRSIQAMVDAFKPYQ
jgi:hypothetical protein